MSAREYDDPAESHARLIGRRQALEATSDLIDKAFVASQHTSDLLRRHIESDMLPRVAGWQETSKSVWEGGVDPNTLGFADAAFRPNYLAAQAMAFIDTESWTEAFTRFVQASEVLVRDVVIPHVAEAGHVQLEPRSPQYWRRFANEVADAVGVELDSEQAWLNFKDVYNIRNTEIAHGHRDATMDEALRARATYSSLRNLLATVFQRSVDISLIDIQQTSMWAHAAKPTEEDRDWSERYAATANKIIADGRDALRAVIEAHHPTYPRELALAYAQLSPPMKVVSDEAFAAAMREARDEVVRAWRVASDFSAMTNRVEQALEDRAIAAGVPIPPEALRPQYP